ncbi:MAG: hypothetical protein LBI41_03725 [Lactobacillales bacterium]|jgi:ubiquitin C-terminal hydrolase|nr:hypothetical protein [Lactobacillales bacterium]
MGLNNIGNTCYINAALQDLLNNKEFVDYILNVPESEINRTNPLGSGGKVFYAFKELCQVWVLRDGTSYSPNKLKQVLDDRYPLFAGYGQHDAHEFLITFLDVLHEDLNQSYKAKGLLSDEALSDLSGMNLHYACNKSFIVDHFHGISHTILECPLCHGITHVYEALAFLALPVNSSTLYGLIDQHSKRGQLAPGDELHCDICEADSVSSRTVNVLQFPTYFTVQLKRFRQNTDGSFTKDDSPVAYPEEFDASRYVKDAGKYKLNGVICHYGTLNGGHYTSYVKNNGQWFLCNDSSITPVSKEEALSKVQNAYVLTYLKKEPVIPEPTATATHTPPAKPVITPQPVVVKPISTVLTVPVLTPAFSLSSGIPGEEVFRVYNPNNGMHHYTMNKGEVATLLALGWLDEGVAFKCSANGMPVYRLYNPNDGTHHYTMDENEKDNLVALGWNYEGIAWYALMQGEVPVFRMYNPGNGEHVWTTNYAEVENAVAHGWRYEGIVWYIQ